MFTPFIKESVYLLVTLNAQAFPLFLAWAFLFSLFSFDLTLLQNYSLQSFIRQIQIIMRVVVFV